MTLKFWLKIEATPAIPRGLARKLLLEPPSIKRYSVLVVQARDNWVSMPAPAVQLVLVVVKVVLGVNVPPNSAGVPPKESVAWTNAAPPVTYSSEGPVT